MFCQELLSIRFSQVLDVMLDLDGAEHMACQDCHCQILPDKSVIFPHGFVVFSGQVQKPVADIYCDSHPHLLPVLLRHWWIPSRELLSLVRLNSDISGSRFISNLHRLRSYIWGH